VSGALTVRGLRGATTVDADTTEQVTVRTQELLLQLMERNGVVEDDIISVLFTATADVVSMFPATAARGIGFGAVPLICATEIAVIGATPCCIRVLLHVHTDRERGDLHHVYLHGAQGLRDDLPS
jgi:chorismate mutase